MRRGASRTAASSPGRWVLVTVGCGELRTYPMTAGVELMLGRDLDCDIVLDHHRVSRRHARLRVGTGDALAIEDLGSRSGTRVGAALTPRQLHPLRAGEPIAIGPFRLTALRGTPVRLTSLVVHDPQASAPAPALISVARSAAPVHIRAEPGSGQRTLAEALHRMSGRAGRFVAVDCSGVEPEALAAELFGQERGKPGVFEAAGWGTVLLHAIEALPAALQAQLLQVVEAGEVVRVGGAQPAAITARIVTTAQRDLLTTVEAGKFRIDLYYRLAGATITIPPPRVPALAPDPAAEQRKILDALDQAGGNQTRAAKMLGISRSTLATKLSAYGISRIPRARK